MNSYEQKLKELTEYLPPLTKRADFDEFWDETLRITHSNELCPKMEEYPYPSDYVKVYSISYHGFDQTEIHGWYIVPTFIKTDKYPCLINYHGYSSSRGTPSDFMVWAMMGLAVISIDCRSQGGITGDLAAYHSGLTDNVTNRGILSKYEYYYRAVYMDCLKAIDFAESRPEIDKDRIILHGISQGGGLVMAVSGLDHRHKLAFADVPSNSNLSRRVENSHGAFAGVTEYLKRYPEDYDKAFETLSYFDTMNLADRITCKVFASVALKDDICPPICYMATYNRINSPKEIHYYPFNGHDGAYHVQLERKLQYLRDSNIL